MLMEAVLSAPYPEGAIAALAAEATANDPDTVVFVRAEPQRVITDALDHAGLHNLARRASKRIGPTQATRTVGTGWQIVRLTGTAINAHQLIKRQIMYSSYSAFDRSVAKQLTTARILIGLPGACGRSFGSNRSRGGMNVFHAVNAHPRTHNQVLLDAFARRSVAGELIPRRTTERIETELRLADLILSPSAKNSAGFTQRGVSQEKIADVPYAVDLTRFTPELALDTEAISQCPPPGRRVRLLFVGQISYRKGIPFLIEALRRLEATHDLTLAGPVVCDRLFKGLPVNVRYVGIAGADRLRSLFAAADAFVLPTLEDACALVTFEAAAMGLPIFTTIANGATEWMPKDSWTEIDVGHEEATWSTLGSSRLLSINARSRASARFREAFHGRDWGSYARDAWRVIRDRYDDRSEPHLTGV